MRKTKILSIAATILLAASSGVGSEVAWKLWGTNMVAQAEQQTILAKFDKTITAPPPAKRDFYAPLITSFNNIPYQAEPKNVADPIGTLEIPRMNRKLAILEGVDVKRVLDTGSGGHYIGTAMPGQKGNFSVAVHRSTHGSGLYEINTVHNGDVIIVSNPNAVYVYKQRSHHVVVPTDVSVINPVPEKPVDTPLSGHYITLTTCDPIWSSANRWIVHGDLVGYYDRRDGKIPPVAEIEKQVANL